MPKATLVLLAMTVLLGAGCNHLNSQGTTDASSQAAALKQAHDTGILTDAEYHAKLHALRASVSTAAQPGTPKPRTAAAGNTWHMKRATFRQNTGYPAMPQWGIQAREGKDVDAISMLIPVDWEFKAGPASGPFDCNMTTGRMIALAFAPDKTAGVLIFPGRVSLWSNDRGLLQTVQANNQQFHGNTHCVIEQPQPLSSALPTIAKGLNKDAEITGPMEPVPGLSDKLPGMLEQANQALAQKGAHIDATAGRIPIRGTDNGLSTEGYFSTLQVVRTDRLPNGGTVTTTDYPMEVVTFAPQGKYSTMEPMFNAMLDSVAIDPDYSAMSAQVSANIISIHQQTLQRLNRIASEMAEDNANAARQQANIRAGVQAYSNQVHANVAANRSAALDHSAQQFALHMNDQAIYRDPNTGSRVQMSNQYSHAWASTTGNSNEYILTDSPSYNPNGQVGSGSWTQLQQER